jgi:phosphopentomutase
MIHMEVIKMTHALKMRKQFILDPKKIKTVRKITKAKTDTEAIDKVMDIVIADSNIRNALMSIRGKGKIRDIYGRCKD